MDFEDAGVPEALARLASSLPNAPDGYLLRGRFDELDLVTLGGARLVAAARVGFGETLEAIAAANYSSLRTRDDAASREQCCQLYFDSYCAAIWTSAHAEFVSQLEMGISEPAPPSISSIPCAAASIDLSDLFARRVATKNESSPKGVNALIALLSRCTNPGARGWDVVLAEALKNAGISFVVTNAIQVLLCGFHPAVSPARRPNWRSRMNTLRQPVDNEAINKNANYAKEAIRYMLCWSMAASPATHAALSHLGHPVRHLHQPPKQMPHAGMEAVGVAFMQAGTVILDADSPLFGSLVKAIPFAFEARGGIIIPHKGHKPIGWLGGGAGGATPRPNKGGATPQPNSGEAGATPQPLADLAAGQVPPFERSEVYDISWLGKGTANVHARLSLVSLATEVWTSAYKSNFIAFWLFTKTHGMRATRLDAVQHAAIHGMNTATKLVALLPDEELLWVQRRALRNPSAGILTLAEVASELGIEGITRTSTNCGSLSTKECVRLIGEAGPRAAAMFLAYARVAWLSEEVLVVDLGQRVADLQTIALRRRHHASDDTPLDRLPVQATHLCACCECRRVANAFVSGPDHSPWNEIGLSASAFATGGGAGGDTPRPAVHCAKRSSAALRTALAGEAEMKSAKIEQSPVDGDALVRLLARAKPHPNGAGAGRSPAQTNESLGGEAAPNESLGGEAAPSQASPYDESGISARVRRDSKNTLEQRPMALACGARPMTQIGILGKAIKIYKSWYALCTHCAALVKLDPSLHFFGSDVCCLRCDNLMLRVDAHAHATRDLKKVCRFCGCMDEGRGSVRWRCVKAPLDIAGPNALLPPPLRTVRASLSLRESNPPKRFRYAKATRPNHRSPATHRYTTALLITGVG